MYDEDEDALDYICPVCAEQGITEILVLGPEQEYGQEITSLQPLVLYGYCRRCEEHYSFPAIPIPEADEDSEPSYVL